MAKKATSAARQSKPKPSPIPMPDGPTMKGCTASPSSGNGYPAPSSPEPQATPPIHVAIPNTTTEKLQAIVMLCAAVQRLSAALDSVNCPVLIKNCHISHSAGHVLQIEMEATSREERFARQVAEYIASDGKRS